MEIGSVANRIPNVKEIGAMTNEEYVKSIYPAANCTFSWGHGYVIGGTHDLFLDFKTKADTEKESWKICAKLIKKHLPDLMLEKLES